jgi:hypothetical protein
MKVRTDCLSETQASLRIITHGSLIFLVVSLSHLDRLVQAEERGIPIGRVDQQTWPERDTTATRRSSIHGRSSQLPWPACVAASVAAILSHGLVRPLAIPAPSCHGGSDRKWTKLVALAVVQQTRVFFTNPIAALNQEFSSILWAENPVTQSTSGYNISQ